jgi:DNA-binding response OmpR family regulator
MTETETATILIQEADILVRNPLAEYLRACGYRVIEVSNADQARQVFDAGSPTVDVLFASVNGDNGVFALASWVRSNRRGVEVILAGAIRTAVEKAGDLCEQGPNLAKPYDHQLVHDRIRRLLAARARAEPMG